MAELPEHILLRSGERIPVSALDFATSRSGGPGGQNVNKVETRVEVRLTIPDSQWLSRSTQERLLEKLGGRIDASGTLRLVSASERSQLGNRIAVIERLTDLLNQALTPEKKRKTTRPSRASKQRRLEKKKAQSQKKERRRWRPGE